MTKHFKYLAFKTTKHFKTGRGLWSLIFILVLILFQSNEVIGQISPFKVSFLHLNPPDSQKIEYKIFVLGNREDSLKVKTLYKNYHARNIATYIKNGELWIDLICEGDIFLCFAYEDLFGENKQDEILIDLQLKRSGDGSSSFKIHKDSLATNYGGTLGNRLVLYNLTARLTEFYTDPVKNQQDLCCPDQLAYNARQEALKKVCQVFSIKKGIKISIGESDYYNSGIGAYLEGSLENPFFQPVPDIDPLKYVRVYEHRKNRLSSDIIWDSGERPHGDVVDINSEIIIEFKLDQLKSDIDFEGNLSLMANINNQPIEIPHYSEVGEEFTKIGVKSASPREFALSFLTAIYEVYNLSNLPIYKEYYSQINQSKLKEFVSQELLVDLKAGLQMYFKTRKNEIPQYNLKQSDATNILAAYPDLFNDVHFNFVNEKIKETEINNLDLPILRLIEMVEEIEANELDDTSKKQRSSLIKNLKNLEYYDPSKADWEFYNSKDHELIGPQLKTLLIGSKQKSLYLKLQSSIENPSIKISQLDTILFGDAATGTSGIDTEFDVISLIDIIDNLYLKPLDFAEQNLSETTEYLLKFNQSDIHTRRALSTVLNKDTLFLAQGFKYMVGILDRIKNIKTEFEFIREEFLSKSNPEDTFSNNTLDETVRYRLAILQNQFSRAMEGFFYIMNNIRKLEEIEYQEATQYYMQKHGIRKTGNSPEFLEDWSEYLAQKAARQIYKKLDPAKIDLSLNKDIRDGQKLELYLLLISTQQEKPKKYLISSFIIKDLGWNLGIVESLLLIDRINEQRSPIDNRNSTNFKPTAGVSMLWTFNGRLKRFNENSSRLSKKPYSRLRSKTNFFNWLKPSFGINVSYLDFVDDNQFEIGAGPVMGLFNNLLFFTAGYNFNVEGVAPTYMGVGFSFTNVIRDIEKLTSSE